MHSNFIGVSNLTHDWNQKHAVAVCSQTFEEIIESQFEKYVDAYDEICEQLRYIETTKKNERLYTYYRQYEKQLLKGKRRKEKLVYRYMREEIVEKMKEIVKTRKIIDGYKDIVRMKKLRKMRETDFSRESKWYTFWINVWKIREAMMLIASFSWKNNRNV